MRLAVIILLTIGGSVWAAPRGDDISHLRDRRSPKLSVIQGQTAARGEFPWMAQLKRDGSHVCSAVLLSEQWLVTAAHCLTPSLNVADYQVILGEYDVSVEEGSEQRRGIAEMMFSDLTTTPRGEPAQGDENDIALIRLDKPVLFTTYVKAIALPQFEEEFAGRTAVASGWGVSGSTAVGPIFPQKLQKMSMLVLSDVVCLDTLIYFDFVPGPMSCAEPPAGSSLCWGDSGGALTHYRASTGQPVLAAVTSWGVDCDLNKRPTVFVDIGFFVNWIVDVIA